MGGATAYRHLKSHMRELGEATASLERSHDLETHLLKGNRTLQEQSVECVCTSRPSGGGYESFQILHSLVPRSLCWRRLWVSNTREWELLQLSAANMKPELKSSGDDLTTLQMEKTASRDNERVKLLSFQTELVTTLKQLLCREVEIVEIGTCSVLKVSYQFHFGLKIDLM
eukprot:Em0006g730a